MLQTAGHNCLSRCRKTFYRGYSRARKPKNVLEEAIIEMSQEVNNASSISAGNYISEFDLELVDEVN